MTDATSATHTTGRGLAQASSRLGRILALSAAERRWLTTAFVALLRARIGLRFRPITQVPVRARTLESDPFASQADRLDAAHEIGRALDAAALLMPRSGCLARALAAQTLLRRRGLPSRVHVGFLRGAGPGRGHAWLECEGEVVVGDHPQLNAFVPTMVFDA